MLIVFDTTQQAVILPALSNKSIRHYQKPKKTTERQDGVK